MNASNGKFTFQAVVDFEIDPNEATALLADPFPNTAVENWLTRNCPVIIDDLAASRDRQRITSCELDALKKSFGLYLADKKVAERKQLSDINLLSPQPAETQTEKEHNADS